MTCEDHTSLSLYIHWPFCRKKCPYCDFNSHVRDTVDHKAWAESLKAEMRYFHSFAQNREVVSIFFGGGTPSLMQAATIQTLIEEADRIWGLAKDAEITMEANPTSTEAEQFKAFRQAGINRVSVGVQSLRDKDLSFLGREHSAAEALKAIEIARQHFDRMSFDMIYARPEQSLKDWETELQEALKLEPDHLSLYQLMIEEGTAFHTQYKSGRFDMPDTDLQADFYDLTQDMLEARGLPAYEISNHARHGEECRHNLTYWRYEDYVGIGPGAHGRFVTDEGKRIATRTHKAPEIWMQRVKDHGHGTHPFEEIDNHTAFDESMMVGLRLRNGIRLAHIEERTGLAPLAQISARKIGQMVEAGFLRLTNTHLIATSDGLRSLDSLLRYLLV